MNKGLMLELDLQLFSDDYDDAILPDDFVDTPVEETQELQDEQPIESDAEDTKPAEDQLEAPVEPVKIPIKYNKEERLITVEEAAELAQKGMNYEKAVERAKQEARDAYIAEQGYEWQGKKITTEAEYKRALEEKDLLDKYADVPDEIRQELIENRRFREQYQSQQKEQESKAKQENDYADFLAAFPDVDASKIKPETWKAVGEGVPLKYAYMEQERTELLSKVKVHEQNEKNKQKAPVRGVTDHGTGDISSDPFLEGFDSIQ